MRQFLESLSISNFLNYLLRTTAPLRRLSTPPYPKRGFLILSLDKEGWHSDDGAVVFFLKMMYCRK
jgi:hypothetical protein